jgi:LCP family protein required for cell wall assembly
MSDDMPDESGPKRVLDDDAGDTEGGAAAPSGDYRHQRALDDAPIAAEDGHRSTFGGSAGWTVLAAIVPPIGLIRSGRKALGWLLLGVMGGALIGLGYVLARYRTQAIAKLTSYVSVTNLTIVGVAISVAALLWVMVIGYTHLKTRPPNPPRWQRAAGGVLVGLLAFAVAAPAAVAVRYLYDTSSLLGTVFTNSKSATRPTLKPTATSSEAADPFNGRLNILILGGDNGFSRDESLGARTDSVMVASIDTTTGDTVLIGLPRNTARMPFPPSSPLYKYYPDGFYDGSNPDNEEYMLNAMYDNVPATVGKNILGETDNVGADVLKLSVGYALGLNIDYYVMINLDGFKDLIDALGGITVNINYRIPKGGSVDHNEPPPAWLEPGPNQHLDGTDALWYARGRYGLDDYSRMERQRCVIAAVVRQADPVTVLSRYEAITKAGKQIIRTDIQSDILPSLLTLATKVKEKNDLKSIVFKHGVDGFYSTHPDWDMVRTRVATALKQASATPATTSAKPTSQASSSASSTPTTKTTSTSSSSTSTQAAEDTAEACAYNPKS